jgi:hypothetical protein
MCRRGLAWLCLRGLAWLRACMKKRQGYVRWWLHCCAKLCTLMGLQCTKAGDKAEPKKAILQQDHVLVGICGPWEHAHLCGLAPALLLWLAATWVASTCKPQPDMQEAVDCPLICCCRVHLVRCAASHFRSFHMLGSCAAHGPHRTLPQYNRRATALTQVLGLGLVALVLVIPSLLKCL